MMTKIDWRELYASNRAAIERAGGSPGRVPAAAGSTADALGAPAEAFHRRSRPDAVSDEPRGAERTVTVAGRRALVHAPERVSSQTALPLVCMLHGCSQDAATFAGATRMSQAADRYGFVAVYPQQGRGENQQGCWNWFLPEHQARGAGEPAVIAAIVRAVIDESQWTIDTRRVFVAGLSAGGAMAAIAAATYPDLFAAVAVHSGLAYGSAGSMGAAFAAMAQGGADPAGQGRAALAAMGEFARPVPSVVVHGNEDRTVAPINAEQVLAQGMTVNRLTAPERCDLDVARPSAVWRRQQDGGHAYTRSRWTDCHGAPMHELLRVDGLGHAWSGGTPGGSYTDPRGPDATEAIWRFFTEVAGAG